MALQRLLAVGDRVDSVAGAAQQPGQVLAHVGVVVGDENTRYGVATSDLEHRVARCQRRLAHLTGAGIRLVGNQRSASWTYGSATPEAAGRPPVDATASAGRCAEPKRQPDRECGARTFGAVGGDGAAVQADQLLHQSQPDSAALVGACARGLDAVEPLEQPGHLVGGHADAGVGDGDHRVAVLATHPHGDRCRRR